MVLMLPIGVGAGPWSGVIVLPTLVAASMVVLAIYLFIIVRPRAG